MQPFQFSENDNPLDIRYDPIFKAVFTRQTQASKGALSSLVSACIGRAVTVDTITANEPPVDDARDRLIRYDISCIAATGEQVNIEMTLFPSFWERERLEFYAARKHGSQESVGLSPFL